MKATPAQIAAFERVSARVLGVGIWASALALGLGLILRGLGIAPLDVHVLNAGLVILMVTPALRVVVSLAEYLSARDWFFVATTLAVLLVLVAGVLSALLVDPTR